MSDWEALLLVLLIVGIIASNLVVLKHTAKFKMHQYGDHKDKSIKSQKKDEEDSAKSRYPKYKEWDDDKED
ncbi:MAG: DUF2897 family protein [Shewanella sp.]|nr:DUF2897 family protein [Shewanella sp.]MCF1431581.1 DUF2897 family protein [Shewanella sp.]MCF1437889.1 DUF2897 family protein [Shewanella sp.]MCF1456907.1 DUF2897 family protein [Shewanella sp.]